jgi:hypothetical protein
MRVSDFGPPTPNRSRTSGSDADRRLGPPVPDSVLRPCCRCRPGIPEPPSPRSPRLGCPLPVASGVASKGQRILWRRAQRGSHARYGPDGAARFSCARAPFFSRGRKTSPSRGRKTSPASGAWRRPPPPRRQDWRRAPAALAGRGLLMAGEEDLPRIGRLAAPSPSSAPRLAPGACGASRPWASHGGGGRPLHRGGGRPSVSRYALAPGQPSPATASRCPPAPGVRAPSSVALTPRIGRLAAPVCADRMPVAGKMSRRLPRAVYT